MLIHFCWCCTDAFSVVFAFRVIHIEKNFVFPQLFFHLGSIYFLTFQQSRNVNEC